jgi:hypothetical protein
VLPDRGGGPKPTWHGSTVSTVIFWQACVHRAFSTMACGSQCHRRTVGHAVAIPVALVIPTRHTNRRPFDDVAVGPAEQRALRQIALEEGSWPQVIEDPMQRRTRQRLAARAHREQLADPGLRRRARPLDEHQP